MKVIFSKNNVLLVLFLLLLTAFPANLFAETDYNVLKNKAERFFQYEEWHSAIAMYQLMLMQRPAETDIYAKAITVTGILNDKKAQMTLIEKSQQNRVPLHALFPKIQKESFSVSEPQVYENFLLLMRDQQPWLKRGINLQLLKYYSMRNNAPQIIETADLILADIPTDAKVLREKAKGYFVSGDNENACKFYIESLKYDDKNFKANLFVGMHYYQKWQSQGQLLPSAVANTAAQYLNQAYSLKPTPEVRKYLDRLGQ